jgi:hypothetical protein
LRIICLFGPRNGQETRSWQSCGLVPFGSLILRDVDRPSTLLRGGEVSYEFSICRDVLFQNIMNDDLVLPDHVSDLCKDLLSKVKDINICNICSF